jgi:hypothetical protein
MNHIHVYFYNPISAQEYLPCPDPRPCAKSPRWRKLQRQASFCGVSSKMCSHHAMQLLILALEHATADAATVKELLSTKVLQQVRHRQQAV